MTCQECELRLGAGEAAEEHLAVCPSCRALAEELRANAAAFESLAEDPLPAVRHRVTAQNHRRRLVRWALAAAAILIAIVAIPWNRQQPAPVQVTRVPVESAPQPSRADLAGIPERSRKKRVARPAPAVRPGAGTLTVKMLTPDPDVVIYWQFESEDR